MQILINGNLAVINQGSSFDFVFENRLFTGSDSYTLSISFPLKDCPQNKRIFGHVNRKDVLKQKVVYECEIRDRDFVRSGVAVITEISETEVKTQFLEGRSEQNFNETFDEIYINELNLGYPADRTPQNNTIPACWHPWPQNNYVPLPWVNNTSGNLQNEVKYENNRYEWKNSQDNLSFQPYLMHILKKICECVGYTYDFLSIEATNFRLLLICNTLPAPWDLFNFAYALPHWSLTEFFEQLELFLYGEFLIDHKAKHISFKFTDDIINNISPVHINNVVNEYKVELSQEDETEYIGVRNLTYAENDNLYWPYRSCAWFINEYKRSAVRFETITDLLNYTWQYRVAGVEREERGTGWVEYYTRGFPMISNGHKLFYAADMDTYFIMFCYKTELYKTFEDPGGTYNSYLYYYRLEPINQFGSKYYSKDAEDLEIKCVPAWIEDTDDEHGRVIFLECGEMGSNTVREADIEEGNEQQGTLNDESGSFANASFGGSAANKRRKRDSDYYDTEADYNNGALAQSRMGNIINKGEEEKNDAYFDCIYMAFWDGATGTGKQPKPIIDFIETKNDFSYATFPYTLRLNHPYSMVNRSTIYDIDGKQKYNFSFISDEIPNPRAVFYIRGGKYLCEKLTVQFTENGRSQLIKGVFYRMS